MSKYHAGPPLVPLKKVSQIIHVLLGFGHKILGYCTAQWCHNTIELRRKRLWKETERTKFVNRMSTAAQLYRILCPKPTDTDYILLLVPQNRHGPMLTHTLDLHVWFYLQMHRTSAICNWLVFFFSIFSAFSIKCQNMPKQTGTPDPPGIFPAYVTLWQKINETR